MLLQLVTAAALLSVCVQTIAQQKVEDGTTIRVYTNLLQIPVLILDGRHQSLPPIEPGKFLLRIGTYPPFHPRVRLEGEDPITLAVLIDGSFDGPNLPLLSEGLAGMVRDQMHPQDRLTLYGLDGCKLRRTLGLMPTDADTVLAATKTLLEIPPFVHHWHGEKCASPIALWDAVAWVAQSLQGQRGRRVLLVITNGGDQGSKLDPDAVKRTATLNGVAIFSLAERYHVRQGGSFPSNTLGGDISSALAYISEGSGGMVMETTRNNVGGTLGRFPALLRGRYIVEFSRPAGITAGQHVLNVTVGQSRDFIRSAGTSMPVADPVTRDPAVEHGVSDPALAARVIEAETPEPAALEPAVQAAPAPAVPTPVAAPPVPVQVVPPARKLPADPTDITDEVQKDAGTPGRP